MCLSQCLYQVHWRIIYVNLLSVMQECLHCLPNFLVLADQFAEGCSYDVPPDPCMADRAHGYSANGNNELF